MSAASVGGGALEGGVKGGSIGSAFGPTGALVGAGLGALAGGIGGMEGPGGDTAANLIRTPISASESSGALSAASQKAAAEGVQQRTDALRGGITGMTSSRLAQISKNMQLGQQAAQIGTTKGLYDLGQERIKMGIGLQDKQADRAAAAKLAMLDAKAKGYDPYKDAYALADKYGTEESAQTLAGMKEAKQAAENEALANG